MIPPVVHWVKVNTLNAEDDEVRTQPVSQALPVFAKVTDNKSGVGSIMVRFNTPEGKFIEAKLNKVVGQEDVYGAMLSIPKWWGAGEYELLSLWATDKAGKTVHMFRTTHPLLENAVINLTQDDAMHDTQPPTLFSVWVDQTEARLGEPVTVNAIITDDLSGVGTLAVNFTPVPSYINRSRVHLKPVTRPDVIQKAGLDVSQNLWTGQIETDEWMEPGEWKIDRIMARDNADNYLDLLPEYVPEIDTIRVTFHRWTSTARADEEKPRRTGRCRYGRRNGGGRSRTTDRCTSDGRKDPKGGYDTAAPAARRMFELSRTLESSHEP